MRVHLPFQPQWHAAVLSGRKTTTVRTRRFGEPGDEFLVDGHLFRLVSVEQMPLARACERHWRDEGMASPDEFERAWVENHPTRGWRPADAVWVHTFQRVAVREDEG